MQTEPKLLPSGSIFRLNKKRGVLYTIGILAGLAIGFLFFSNRVALAPDTESDLINIKAKEISPVILNINDQLPGAVALVNSLETDRAGWIVIRENNEGELGNILGARYVLSSGTFKNVEVELLRGMEENKGYFALYYNDNGDKIFDFTTDLPLEYSSGKIFLIGFSVQVASSRGD